MTAVLSSDETFFREQLERYRLKLLNLSLRNRLLNFQHSARGRNYLRVIDTSPDLFLRSIEDRPATIIGLPDPPEEPEDERTPEFEHALIEAWLTDQKYVDALKKLDEDSDDNSQKRQQLELELRNRVRLQLGLPSRSKAPRKSVEEWAKDNGIPPDYSLSIGEGTDLVAAKPERIVQTRLFRSDLERSVNRVHQLAKQSMQEMGINTLYAAVGFLEWYESEDSAVARLAPLLLHAVEIKKVRKNNQTKFGLSSLGEETEGNVTLTERAKAFGVNIPTYQDGQPVGAYLEAVADAVSNQPRWKIRPFISVTNLSFSRMVLYKDLDPALNTRLNSHAIARDLLMGKVKDGPEHAEVYYVDDEEIASTLRPLIADADASQLSAIKDAMDGKNMVVKGPPGTGKSQTITNLIAATIARGKTVLFVAEKMAALEVVRKRLEEAELGPFILELHSTKAKREDVMRSFRERLDIKLSGRSSSALEETRTELVALRRELTEYASTINKVHGSFGLTINELIWKLQLAQEEVKLPPMLQATSVDNIEKLAELDLGRIRGRLNTLERAKNLVESQYGRLENHPWYGLESADITPFVRQRIVTLIQDVKNELSTLMLLVQSAEDRGFTPALRDIDSIETVLLEQRYLPRLAPELDAAWLQHLLEPDVRTSLQQFARRSDLYSKTYDRFKAAFTSPPSHTREVAQLLKQSSAQAETLGVTDRLIADLPRIKEARLQTSSQLI